MSYFSCENPNEHKREGEEDFNRRGSYGYDSQKYHDEQDDCNRAYTDGFDEARRADERRQEEERAQEEAEERRQYERQSEIRQQDDIEHAQICEREKWRSNH